MTIALAPAPAGPTVGSPVVPNAIALPDVSIGFEQLEAWVSENLEAAFVQLFAGSESAFGFDTGGSVCKTAHEPLTPAQYRRHLGGPGTDAGWSLGVIPLRSDGRLSMGALDFDAVGLSDEEASAVVQAAKNLPIAWSDSRSGGLHGWVFFTEPVPAADASELLRAWAVQLGWREKAGGDSKQKGARFFEIFPKQATARVGNWIRLPFPGGPSARVRRGRWLREASQPSLTQWLALCIRQRMTPSQFADFLAEIRPSSIPLASPGSPTPTTAIGQPNGPDATSVGVASLALSAGRDPEYTLADLRFDLAHLGADRVDGYDDWLHVAMCVHHQFAGTPDETEAIALLSEWSATSAKYEAGDIQSKWRSFAPRPSGKELTIRSLRLWADTDGTAAAIATMNKQYATILAGGGSILWTPPTGEPVFLEKRRWEDHLKNQSVGNKKKPISHVWLSHPDRRSFETIVFDPTKPSRAMVPARSGTPGAFDFNLYPGFALTPSSGGSCDLILAHIRNVVCCGDEKHSEWVLMWLGAIFQEPENLAGTALVVRGAKGAGKSLLGEIVGEMLGSELYAKISKPAELTGRFNGLHQGKLLLQVEEGFFAGDRSSEGALKNLITSPTVLIERKFAEAISHPNYVRLLITSNADWVVPAGLEERRFAVLTAAANRKDDFAYFEALRREAFNEGGCARFLAFLRDEVVVDWDVIRRPPQTSALLEQQLNSLGAADRWLLDILFEGALPGDVGGEGVVGADQLFETYRAALREAHNPYDAKREKMGRFLRDRLGGDLVKHTRTRRNGARPWAYAFASLELCRRRFAQHLAQAPEWGDIAEWERQGPWSGHP